MQHRRIWARIMLVVFLLGLIAGAYGLYANNPAITRPAVAFIVLAAFAAYILRKDFQRELDEIDQKRREEKDAQEATENQSDLDQNSDS